MLLNKYTAILLFSTMAYACVAYILLLNPFYSKNTLLEDVILVFASIFVLASTLVYNIAMFASETNRRKARSA